MRTHYRNGHEITLKSTGCDGCSPCTINGMLSHEQGCPDAWRDRKLKCRECHQRFNPEIDGQQYCDDCYSEAR